ncbi:ABC transporter permease [Enterococcus olivae]
MKKIVVPILLFLFGLYYLSPLIATFFYASSTSWGKSIIPDDFTLQWFQQLLGDPAFLWAVGRSFLLAGLMTGIIFILLVPTMIWINLYFPRWDKALQKIVLLPYAIPGVILVTALLRTYSKSSLPMFLVLLGALFISMLPVVYLGISNQMRLVNMKELVEAAETLGSPMFQIIRYVLIPNLKVGTTLVSLMVFSSVFGEYMLTNLLIGGRFETLRIYMLRRMNENGHVASAVMILYFLFLLAVAFGIFYMNKKQRSVTLKLKKKETAEVKTNDKLLNYS